jgi:hypothetical protein
MFRSRRKFQRNLHDNIHYRSVEVDGLKVFYREARKVDAHLSTARIILDRGPTRRTQPINRAVTADQGCGLTAADER